MTSKQVGILCIIGFTTGYMIVDAFFKKEDEKRQRQMNERIKQDCAKLVEDAFPTKDVFK